MFKKTSKNTNFDKISSLKIRRTLKISGLSNKIFAFPEIDSTNRYAKSIALKKNMHGAVVVSDSQTNGRGRLGRSFFSPPGSGIYMSIIVYPKQILCDPSLLTVIACVAVCKTIEKYVDDKVSIKWVNDIFMNGKKICGILTEAGTTTNSKIGYFVVGIGLNVSTPTEIFPGELQSIAGSLGLTGASRNNIIADIIYEFMKLCMISDNSQIINEYKSRSMVIGKKVSFINGKNILCATAIDINNQGNLLVKLEDGSVKTLKSGEITLGSQNFTG